ncbi:AraC family transcriptional regulator [Emticicia aquatilis]|uniref:AraC family transcriptional regulator n=1 Tax=Emticicia aquatilis TaxID=1537369 RepID=A0A917DPY2_9BACT|nr:AraC family transcriptional regulator [Emticicia aquatilis]GGD58846.1 AraC family transcriptional regulator [Emticicia aquatilis]
MKAVFEQLNTEQSSSFIFRKFDVPKFDAPFHFHPEYELTLVLKGEGQRYVGQQVHEFFAGDLVFLGANLPHCWINQAIENENASAIVIQFGDLFLGKGIVELPEMKKVQAFLEKSKSGFEIIGKTKEILTERIVALQHKTALQKIAGLLEIFDILSHSTEIITIDDFFFEHQYNQSETARFQKVFSYLIENFKEEITLEQIANIADLSPTSFCRYFKNITKKTFVEVLIEFRLQYACQLLNKTDLPIQQVAFESGFGDVPYFNKLFRKHKNITPKEWRGK